MKRHSRRIHEGSDNDTKSMKLLKNNDSEADTGKSSKFVHPFTMILAG